MKAASLPPAIRLLASFALVVALVSPCAAQDDASGGTPPAMGKIGPGAPPATPKAASPKSAAKAVAKGIALAPSTPVASDVNVHDKVLDKCQLETLLPQSIAERNSEVVLTGGAAAMKLDLKIVDIHAPSGGVFSGPKWVTVEGRLYQGKTLKGSFVAKESSMGATGTCGMLGKVVRAIGADIAVWLRNPAKDSRLGHAR